MTAQRDIYYISGNSTILAEDMAKALFSQFPDTHFHQDSSPFIGHAENAHGALDKILSQPGMLK